jgi:hypothetical protein
MIEKILHYFFNPKINVVYFNPLQLLEILILRIGSKIALGSTMKIVFLGNGRKAKRYQGVMFFLKVLVNPQETNKT